MDAVRAAVRDHADRGCDVIKEELPPQVPSPRVAPGTAGASARREYERRSAAREARIRADHRILGGLILALTDEPQSMKAWAVGTEGERVLGQHLDGLASRGAQTLHDGPSAHDLPHLPVAA